MLGRPITKMVNLVLVASGARNMADPDSFLSYRNSLRHAEK